MNQLIVSEKHTLMASVEEVADICKPLFLTSPIDHFCWLKAFDDGQMQALITNRELVNYHLNVKNHIICPWVNETLLSKHKFYYLGLPDIKGKFDHIFYDYKSFFNTHHAIYLFERHENYYETFVYASHVDDQKVINFYLNHMDVLENFKLYFKDKAALLIQKTVQNKIIIPESMKSNITGIHTTALKELSPVGFDIKRYQIHFNNQEFTLSKREMEVTQYLAQGYTVKESAKMLQLSPRTVEQYVNIVKKKAGLKRKNQIITLVRSISR